MILLSLEEVLNIHDDMVSVYGGARGVRSMSLLVSAIEMPKATMSGEGLHENIFDKAAAYMYHIICNRPFVDGNKRTGTAIAIIFLDQNKIELECDIEEIERIAILAAQNKVTKKEISAFFESVHQVEKRENIDA